MSKVTTPISGRSKSQLLPNRGVLTRINPVVRKKTKTRNVHVPPEWDQSTAQAYRLLVGPKINNYVDEKDIEESKEKSEIEEIKGKEKEEKESFLNKLYPSRLGEKYEPFEVTVAQLDALTMPNDLLVQVLPPGTVPKYDLILNSQKKKTAKKKLQITKEPLPSLSTSVYDDEKTLEQPVSLKTIKSFLSIRSFTKMPDLKAEEEEEAGEKNKDAVKPDEKKTLKSKTLDEIEKQIAQKAAIRLRMYFYVLRCWACYNINARSKSVFITNVDNSRLSLHYLRHWNSYVQKKLDLRRSKKALDEYISRTQQTKYWSTWKSKSTKAIKNAAIAAAYLEKKNKESFKKILLLYKDCAHSKKTARRDIQKFFRFKPNGPFKEVNEYYTDVRAKNIKAMHHFFIKEVPPVIKVWRQQVLQRKKDNQQIAEVHVILRKFTFADWFEAYKDHFHSRILSEVRRYSKILLQKGAEKEKESAERVEKTVIIQLVHDRNILNAKLSQFDRLSQNHKEAVLRRGQLRGEITAATNKYFVRQEELSLVDSFKQASEVERKTREIRMQLAEGFLFHLGRAVRSYDNQVVAHEYCLAFRVLSNPIVERAVGYFYEKKHIKSLLASAVRSRKALKQATTCVKLYHQCFGWNLWRKYIEKMNENRSSGIMADIRRRTQIMQLYPYFNWVEVLPVRPPRPLKEVEMMFKDLPLVSIQRKVARERVHHVNVRMMLMKRRMLRDFLRAYASYVQEQIATRSVIMLMKKKRNATTLRRALACFQAKGDEVPKNIPCKQEDEISANITAWFRHFFRERSRQRALVSTVPFS